MRIEIIGRNYNVPDRLKSVIERKFEKLKNLRSVFSFQQ